MSNKKRDIYLAAFRKLPDEEQEKINNLADAIVENVKAHNKRVIMSREGAIELLGALGVFLAKNPGVKA